MSDLISRVDRKAVIDAIHQYWFEKIDELPKEGRDGYEVYADTETLNAYLKHNKNLSTIVKELPSAEPESCESCDFCDGLESGDKLFQISDWDGGIGFDYIYIKYCPMCGRRL